MIRKSGGKISPKHRSPGAGHAATGARNAGKEIERALINPQNNREPGNDQQRICEAPQKEGQKAFSAFSHEFRPKICLKLLGPSFSKAMINQSAKNNQRKRAGLSGTK